LTRSEILKGIQYVFNEYLQIESAITPEVDITNELQLDSLELLTLIVELENHFLVAFEHGDEKDVKTIEDLIRLIEKSIISQYGDSNG